MSGIMRAMVLHDWVTIWGDNLRLEQRPVPALGPEDVLVRVRACGVGLTVSNFMTGEAGRDPQLLPRIPGHEVAGEVAEMGPRVDETWLGRRVLLYFYLVCDACSFCLAGQQNLCRNFRGMLGRHVDGGYAEYVRVPISNLLPLPEDISFTEATAINDAIATPVHIFSQRVYCRPGDTVLIVGAGGGVGIHAVQVARLHGAVVIAADTSEEKLQFLTQAGAQFVVNVRNEPLVEATQRYTNGRGATVALDFVGSPETLEGCLRTLGPRGTLVNITTHPGVNVVAPSARLVADELSIVGTRYTTKKEFLEAIDLVKSGRVKPIVTRTVPLQAVESLHVLLAAGSLIGRGATIP